MYSRKSQAPAGTIRNGAHDPIRAAFATLLCVAPAKNTARFSPKKTPGIHTARTSRSATRRPVLHRTRFHARLTVASRHNATSTPAVSARLTNVELSENATTSPRTASSPSVFALSPPIHAGARAACGAALIRTHYGVLGSSTSTPTREAESAYPGARLDEPKPTVELRRKLAGELERIGGRAGFHWVSSLSPIRRRVLVGRRSSVSAPRLSREEGSPSSSASTSSRCRAASSAPARAGRGSPWR